MALKLRCSISGLHQALSSFVKPTLTTLAPSRLHSHDSQKQKRKYSFLHRYVFHYIRNYDEILKKRFPSTIGIYRLFKLGVAEFFKDVKDYLKIIRRLTINGDDFKLLTRKEIELYSQMPRDIKKVTPIIVIAALPFTGYVLFPLIFYYPRQLLTSHFWNSQQKSQFTILSLRDRLLHNKPVFRHMQALLSSLEGHELYEPWKEVLAMIGSGMHPTTDKIIHCRRIFSEYPYDLGSLSRNHQKHLMQMHDLSVGFFRRRHRLHRYANLLLEMDRAIMREGGVHNLTTETLRNACFIRGLNSSNMPNEDLIKWLKKWMKISKTVEEDNLSLILHCPILLAYNEQNNWTLIYTTKT